MRTFRSPASIEPLNGVAIGATTTTAARTVNEPENIDAHDAEVCPERLDLPLPRAATVLVCGSLHLRARADEASRLIEHDLADRLDRWEGPGAVVLNGDTVDLWSPDGGETDVDAAFDAHPRLALALQHFAGADDRHVIAVAGEHDARLAEDPSSRAAMKRRIGALCTRSLDLHLTTSTGTRTVRCQHGHQFDARGTSAGSGVTGAGRRNGRSSPGQTGMPSRMLVVPNSPLLADLPHLTDPGQAGQFVASRLLYRHLGRRSGWLLAPLVLALMLRIPLVVHLLSRSGHLANIHRWVVLSGTGLLLDVLAPAALAFVMARTVYRALAAGASEAPAGHLGGAARTAAAALCAEGLGGLVTSHTHQPELTPVRGGFSANTGCGTWCVEARQARWGLPPVFVSVLRRSWVEMDVDHDLRARLVVAETDAGGTTLLEHLALRRSSTAPPRTPTTVANLPGQARWPLREADLSQQAARVRLRRTAAGVVSAVAVISVGSAVTSPLHMRLEGLLDILPVEVPQSAAATLVVISVALLLLARGLRRGHRLAWGIAVGFLGVSACLHLLKGIDVEESLVTAGAAFWLARRRQAFPVRPGAQQVRGAMVTGLPALLIVLGSVVLLTFTTAGPSATGPLTRAVIGRLVGDSTLPLPGTSPFLTPVLAAVGLSLLMVAGLLLTRPRRRREPTAAEHHRDLDHARRLVHRYGGDTLSYFALRDDKRWFFTGDCVVAYAVRGGVCLVAPDPVGPAEQWASAWSEFCTFAERHGWPVTVIGASDGWLPIYEAAGMRGVYMGDEAIVDCTTFTLEGRRMRGLRQAHHRIERAGFTVRFHDPADLDDELREQLRDLMGRSRRGDVERGFSMTLSRVFDPEDTGLMVSVAYGPDRRPAGFCHWVPAADIAGWSLDLMRRDVDPSLPNGLTDFIILETIRHAQAQGYWGLGLNFAVMRGVLAQERGEGLVTDIERRVLLKFSETMQIESLWRFNQKYQPLWRPRHIMLAGTSLGTVAAQGIAIADAEGIAELPVLGRLVAHRAAKQAARQAALPTIEQAAKQNSEQVIEEPTGSDETTRERVS